MAEKTRFILEGVDRTRQTFTNAQRNLGTLEKTAKRAQVAFAALIGAGAIGGAVKSIAQAGLAMEKFERTFISATGSAQAGRREMKFVSDLAEELGLELESTAGAYAKLTAAARGTSLAGTETREIFTAVSQASLVLGLSADETAGALTAVEQIISKGKVSAEELRGQLGERLPGAFQIAARAIGKTTQELDEMLKQGKLAAEDFLPAFADEIQRTYAAEIPDAVDSAAASFNRFGNSMFELKAAIAESGILNALSDMADFASQVAIGFGALFLGSTPEAFGKELEAAQERVKGLRDQIDFMVDEQGFSRMSDEIMSLEHDLLLAELQMESLRKKSLDAMTAFTGARTGAGSSSALPSAFDSDSADSGLERFKQRFETAEQSVARLRAELEKYKDDLDPAEFARIYAEIGKTLTDGLEEFDLNQIRAMKRTVELHSEELSVFAEQAARNMQDHFADFLFDPFEEGLDGMLKGFADVMRRMAAQAVATQLFQGIGGSNLFSGIGKLFGFADGGQFVVGGGGGVDSQLVQFMATPGERVTVEKPGQRIGGATVINNYRFEAGADVITIERRIIPHLERMKSVTKAEIRQGIREGRFP